MKTVNSLYRLGVIALFVIVVANACQKSDDAEPQNTSPIVTNKGTPNGEKASASVGTTGGTLVSEDGNVTIAIPSGALATATTISIQSISNEAPLGIGMGYRLLPEGTVFTVPVKLTFRYNENTLEGIPADFLWVVTQAGDGSWNAAVKSTVDKSTKMVTVETTHFSDWALGKFIDFTLNPSSKTIKKGQSVQLKLSGFSRDKAIDEDDELVPLVPIIGDNDGLAPLTPIPPIESRLMDFRVKKWTMNGAIASVSNSNGNLSASGTSATYTAPNKRPDVNPVAITVYLEANNKEGGKATYMVTSNISVIESDYYLLIKVDGQSYEYFQYGFNGTIPPDPNNISIANCGLTDGKLSLAGSTIVNSANLQNGFGLVFDNPSETTRNLVGFNEDGDDDLAFQLQDFKFYSIDYTKYTYDATHNICNSDYLCGDVSVTLTTYNGGLSVVRGYFSGTIYDETTSAHWDNCKTPDMHTIEGEFNLMVVNSD